MPHILPVSAVVVPEGRQRKTFTPETITELKQSILTNGLINPITVEPSSDGTFILLCGERRLRALRTMSSEQFVHGTDVIPPGHVPAVFIKDLSEIKRAEIEFAENVDREQLPWQERIEAIARLDELRKRYNPSHTTLDTAKEVLGQDVGSSAAQGVREAVRVAAFLDDPDVAKAKSLREATKIVDKKTVQAFERQLVQKLGASIVPATIHTPLCGDTFTILPTLPAHHFDIILTDPPYGVDADTFKMQSSSESGTRHDYSDDTPFAIECAKLIAQEGFRVCKPNAHLYMFCDLELFYVHWRDLFTAAGWTVWPNPIIWDKCGVGMLLGNANGPRHTYEAILFAVKGGRRVTSAGKPDVISIRPSQAALHPAEKPAALYAELLSRSRIPGDSVLDPFMGSGPIFPAANVHTLKATGIERSEHHFATAAKRVTETSIVPDEPSIAIPDGEI